MGRKALLSTEDEEDLEALGRAAVEDARKDIETYGWHVMLIRGDEEPGFLFTVGLWHSFRHPEILLFAPSLDPAGMTGRLQPLAQRVSEGETFTADQPYENLFGRFDGLFRPVDRRWYPWFLGTAMAFYGGTDFPVLQLFWPDRDSLYPWETGFSSELHPFQPLLHESVAEMANLPPSLIADLEATGELETQTLSPSDLFIELEEIGELESLLEDWRWMVGPDAEILRITIFGDLFLTTPDGRIHWLDTGSARYHEVAESVEEWAEAAQTRGPEWFHLRVLLDLRGLAFSLEDDQVYSWRNPPMIGGEESVDNIDRISVRVHLSHLGRLAEAIKDLPPGTPISGYDFEPV